MGNSTLKKKKSKNVIEKNISKVEAIKNSSPVCYTNDDEVQSEYKIEEEKKSK
tara:strand:- start:336 stop:494 length:159 start_codon:yes stop_codon:yes gene_type:complete